MDKDDLFFEINGRPVPSPIENRLIGLGLDELERIPSVICVAGGSPKVASILGALRGGYVSVLITDNETARAVIEGW